MYNYFSLDNFYNFCIFIIISFIYVLIMGGFKKSDNQRKQSVVMAIVIAIVLHSCGYIYSKHSYHKNIEICSENPDYKMSKDTCYKPLKSGKYVPAETADYDLK